MTFKTMIYCFQNLKKFCIVIDLFLFKGWEGGIISHKVTIVCNNIFFDVHLKITTTITVFFMPPEYFLPFLIYLLYEK